jgi:protein-S-isoprenylcysteine O-methyltransferase Ste14
MGATMLLTENSILLAAFILFFILAFIWPSVRVWRQTGRSPYVLPSTDDAYGFVARCMKLLMLSLLFYTVGQFLWPELIAQLNILDPNRAPFLRPVAWAALASALLWTLCAQFQMGRSWRIGIDTREATELVTSGLFARSRNPVFLAMRVCLFSLALLQFNAITLALFLVGDLVMQFQVRLEEAFLRQRHGAAYVEYYRRVRRWL